MKTKSVSFEVYSALRTIVALKGRVVFEKRADTEPDDELNYDVSSWWKDDKGNDKALLTDPIHMSEQDLADWEELKENWRNYDIITCEDCEDFDLSEYKN